ncbi:hypothetical protein EC973_007542, partial [Apophysomyces ossiformis]
MSHNLFTPLKVGQITLQHRVSMAPMTRFRASDDYVPTDLIVKYYEQRAGRPGTLLISEGSFARERAGGIGNIPGFWTQEQLAGWSKVFDAVHAKGSFMFVQIDNLGKAASSEYMAERGLDVVSSVDIPSEDGKSLTARALTTAEVKEFVQDIVTAGKNAVEAGADGVEIHAAN